MKKSSVSCSKNYQIEDDFECIYNLALDILSFIIMKNFGTYEMKKLSKNM